MATYPIKMLRDEDRQPFVPFTNAAAVVDSNNVTLQELMTNGKYKIQNNVTTSSAGKGVLDAYQGKVLNDKFNNYVPLSQKGVANGVATLDADAKVPSSQLPSYVDDVIEAYIRSGATALSSTWLSLTDGGAALTPEKGKIYLIMSSGSYQNKQYRWGGSTYVLCNPSDVNSVNGFTGVVTLKKLTIQKNGIQVGDTFNGSADKTINITVPTKTSDITNNSGFITAADDITGNAATATNATNDGSGNNIENTYVKKAGDVTITGTKTFSTAGGFLYSGIETSSSNSARPVWYGKAGGANGTPTINASQFTYNPGTNVLTVGSIKTTTARTIDGVSYDGSANIIHYGTCSTAAATATKEVTCAGFNKTTGAVIYVLFTVTNTAAVADLKLDVNGTGAAAFRYRGGNLPSTSVLSANGLYCFVYDGTYYQFVGDRDTNDNTYDRIRYNQNIKAGSTAIVAANIIVASPTDGTYTHLKLGNAFDISRPILYAGGAISAGATSNNTYIVIPFAVATTQSLTLTAYKPVYIKGSLDGTTFTPVSATPLTQTVPTSADGYEYIYLGMAYSTTNIYLEEFHPIYAYTGGKFTRINGREITGFSVSGRTVTYTRADNTTGTFTTQDTVYTLPVAGTGINGTLGGVKVGSGLSIDSTTGVLSATGGGTADNVEWSGVLNKPTDISYWNNDSGYITKANVMAGATASTAGDAGVVPAPGSGDQAKYLRGDGQWAIVAEATKATQDGSGNTITSTYVKKAGDTMTGDLTISKATPILYIKTNDTTTDAKIKFGNSAYNKDCIVASYGGANGYNITIDGGGRTILGSGEGATGLASALGKNQDAETMYLISDQQMYFDANGQTIGNRVGFQLNNSGNLVPTKADVATTNSGSIGQSDYQWNTIYGKTIYENGTSISTKYVNKAGDTMTGDLAFASTKGIAFNGTNTGESKIIYNSTDKCIEFVFA